MSYRKDDTNIRVYQVFRVEKIMKQKIRQQSTLV